MHNEELPKLVLSQPTYYTTGGEGPSTKLPKIQRDSNFVFLSTQSSFEPSKMLMNTIGYIYGGFATHMIWHIDNPQTNSLELI